MNKIIHGNALDVLKEIESESVDCICTDPPYGYSFMNKDWDKAVVSVDIWKECLRVMKAGSFAFIMSSPRQDVLCKMILNLIDAGFETNFTSLYYSYASGFPKASNTTVVLSKRYAQVSKSQMSDLWKTIIRKTEYSQESNNWLTLQNLLEDLEQGKQHEIYAYTGSQTKQVQIPERQRQSSMERWNLLQKEKGRLCCCKVCKMPVGLYFNGKKGWICYGTQIDNGSVSWQTVDENGMCSSYQSQPIGQSFRELDVICEQCTTQKIRDTNLNGSYLGLQPKPAVEVVLCVMKPLSQRNYVEQALDNSKGITWLDDCRIPFQNENDKNSNGFLNTKGRLHSIHKTNLEQGYRHNQEIVERYKQDETVFNPNDKGRFPANLLVSDDALNDGKIHKTGHLDSVQKFTNPKIKDYERYQKSKIGKRILHPSDSGSYSRYFSLDKWYEAQFIITPKASPSERQGSTHPTMKPIKLMSYLITMGSRENDIILDPFCGSGTTCIAAFQLNRRFIGIEKEQDYVDIANKRLEPYLMEKKLTDFA